MKSILGPLSFLYVGIIVKTIKNTYPYNSHYIKVEKIYNTVMKTTLSRHNQLFILSLISFSTTNDIIIHTD